MNDHAVVIRNLTKRYDGYNTVDSLSFEIPKESVFALLGPNGAGKTTTIKMLLGLVTPTSGEIHIFGEPVQGDVVNTNQNIGYVSDDPQFYGYMTAGQIIKFCKPLYKKWDDGLVEKVFHLMDIPTKTKIKHMSRGQRAALALALALGNTPQLLILDEPATQFDPLKKQAFYSLLFDDVVGAGGTIILATHQITEVERFADHAAFINKGRLLMVKPVDELKVSEKRIRVVFQGDEPDGIEAWPGVRRLKRQGKSVILTVYDNLDDIWQRLSQHPHYALELIDMDLEDIFLEYAGNGGRGR